MNESWNVQLYLHDYKRSSSITLLIYLHHDL